MNTTSSPGFIREEGIPEVLTRLWVSNGLPEDFLSNLKLTSNPDIAAASSFRVGLAAQISTALAGLSSAYVHYLRTGIVQDVAVDARHAALAFHSEAWYTVDETIPPGGGWDSIAGIYQTKDGGAVRVHSNFPHHRRGVLEVLHIPDSPTPATRSDVTRAILEWDGGPFEEVCAQRGLCVFKMRGREEWEATPQGKALSGVPILQVLRLGNNIVETQPGLRKRAMSKRPLQGLNVLDLSRVLAGPVCGRALGAYGAQVLLITSPGLPSLPRLDIETSLGKRTTQLDLTSTEDAEKLKKLVKEADVFLQAYRPGGLDEKGFSVADVVKMKSEENNLSGNGIVYASLRAWGWDGPWAGRRGFDSLVQTATGFNVDEGNTYHAFQSGQGKDAQWTPRPLPMQALDHAAGFFLTFGINVGLSRMIKEGGSHEVRVSLAAVGEWIRSLGRLDSADAFGPHAQRFPERTWPLQDEINVLSARWSERKGSKRRNAADPQEFRARQMTALRHPVVFGITPVREGCILDIDMPSDADWGAPMSLKADDPMWIK